jgi:hypothetical protein
MNNMHISTVFGIVSRDESVFKVFRDYKAVVIDVSLPVPVFTGTSNPHT